jgi:hypothetical protein
MMLAAGLSMPRAIIEGFNAINNNFLSTVLGLHCGAVVFHQRIQPIDDRIAGSRHQMPIGILGHLDPAMSSWVTDIG